MTRLKRLLSKLLPSKKTHAATTGYAQKQRAPRAQIHAIASSHFKFSGDVQKSVRIANISITGVGLFTEDSERWPDAGALVNGNLFILGHDLPITMRLVHLSGPIAGFNFEGDTQKIQGAIFDLLKTELSAISAYEVKREMLKSEPDGEPRLFYGRDCELFIIEKSAELVSFNLSVFGNYWDYSRSTGKVRCGYVVADEDEGKPKYRGSDLIRYADTVPEEMIRLAAQFIQNVKELQQDRKDAIIRLLQA
jgi:hypothetical protein